MSNPLFRMSLSKGGFTPTGTDAWELLGLGKVYDMEGDEGDPPLVVLDEVLFAELRKAQTWQAANGHKIPIDKDHGTRRHAGNPEKSATFGLLDSLGAELIDGKLTGSVSLTERGKKVVGDSLIRDDDGNVVDGTLMISPVIRGPLRDPKTNELVANAYIESIAMTQIPQQIGMRPIALGKGDAGRVMLARFRDRQELSRFEQALEAAAIEALRPFGHAPDYVSIRDWPSEEDDSGEVVFSFWAEAGGSHLFIGDWSRDGDVVSVTNVSRGVEDRNYRRINTGSGGVSLAKEAHMRKMNLMALCAALAMLDDEQTTVELSKGESAEVEVPETVADRLEALGGMAKGKIEGLKAEITRLNTELSKANTRVEAHAENGGAVAELRTELAGLKAELAKRDEDAAKAKAANEAQIWAESLTRDGRIATPAIELARDPEAETSVAKWAKRYATLGKGDAEALAAEVLTPGTFAPAQLGRGAGLNGEPFRPKAKEDTAVELAKRANEGDEPVSLMEQMRRDAAKGGV